MSRMLFNTVNTMRKTPKIVTSFGLVIGSLALSAVTLMNVPSNAQIIPDASPSLANQAPTPPTDPSITTEQPNLAPPNLGGTEPDASRSVPALPTPDDNNADPANPTDPNDDGVVELADAEAKDQPGELLTRGPVHEAFAKPVAEKVEAPKVLAKKPPAPIEELPPEEKPEGDNVVWIPGYFSWDDERKDYIWISGVYRDTPPGQTWVAGYWGSTDTGYQWVNGFWTAANRQEVEYLPQPPEELNNGPQGQQPSQDHFWVQGNWQYQQNRYMWRTGYWSQCQPGWVWVPAQYYWTPYGYTYSAGYWDLPLADRGLCYTPVYFSGNVWNRPRFRYTPRVALNVGFMTDHLFLNLGYGSYYFGDYYGSSYANYGYRPWCQPRLVSAYYRDPLFSYYSWRYSNVGWANSLNVSYNFALGNSAARPPRTYRDTYRLGRNAQVNQAIVNGNVFQSNHNTINNVNITNITNNNISNTTIANNIKNRGVVNNNDLTVIQARNASMVQKVGTSNRGPRTNANGTNLNGKTQNALAVNSPNLLPVKLEKVDAEKRQQFTKQGNQFQDFSRSRLQQETAVNRNIGGQNPNGKSGINRENFPGKNGNTGIAGQGNNNPLGTNPGTKSKLTLPKVDGVASTSSNARRNNSANNGKGLDPNGNANPLILKGGDTNTKLGNTNPGGKTIPGNRGINPRVGVPDSVLNPNKIGEANKLGDATGSKTIPGNRGINPKAGVPDSVLNQNKTGNPGDNKTGDPNANNFRNRLNNDPSKLGKGPVVGKEGGTTGKSLPNGTNPGGINNTNPSGNTLPRNLGNKSGTGNTGAGTGGGVNNNGGIPGGKLPGGINQPRTFTPPSTGNAGTGTPRTFTPPKTGNPGGANPSGGTGGGTTINPNFKSNQGGPPTTFKRNNASPLGGTSGSGNPTVQPKLNPNPQPVIKSPNVNPQNTNPGGGRGREREKKTGTFNNSNPIVDAGTSPSFQNRSVNPTGYTAPSRTMSQRVTSPSVPTISSPSISARSFSGGNSNNIQAQIRSQPRVQSSQPNISAPRTTYSQPRTSSTPARTYSSPSMNSTSRSSSMNSAPRNFSRGSNFSGGQSSGGRNRQNR